MDKRQVWQRLAPLIVSVAAQACCGCHRTPLGARGGGGGVGANLGTPPADTGISRDSPSGASEPGTLLADAGVSRDSASGGGESGTLLADTGISRDSPSGAGESGTLLADTGVSRDSASGGGESETGRCTGTAAPCYSGTTDYTWECTRQAGCAFVYATGTCQGLPTPCSEFKSDSLCYQQSGCYWYPPTCLGTATACIELSPTTCEKNPGCYLGTGCLGLAVPCSQLQAAICSGTPGCSLNNNGQ